MNRSSILQPGRGGLDGRLEGVRAFGFDLALVDAIAARGEDRVEIPAAEAKVGDPAIRRGDDAINASRLVADLNAHASCDVEAAVSIDPLAVGPAVVGGVWNVKMIVLLL